MRTILHIDMDCFYAAIEERDYPLLRGHPVAVGGSQSRRGVLTTCNYEARKYGLRSAMPTFQALRLCPHLILRPVRFEAYREESRRLRELFREYTDLVEPLSLDEAYLDISKRQEDPWELALELRRRIFRMSGLSASAGVGPNKQLAKIASDWRKPNGQFQIRAEEVSSFMANLPVGRLWGVGEVAKARLAQEGVHTCGDLQKLPAQHLKRIFGKFGLELYHLCRGIDTRPVVPNRPRKSLSVERTYPTDLPDLSACLQQLPDLLEELQSELSALRTERLIHKIFVKVKTARFQRGSAETAHQLPGLANYTELLRQALERHSPPVRLLGLGVRFHGEGKEAEDGQMELPLEGWENRD